MGNIFFASGGVLLNFIGGGTTTTTDAISRIPAVITGINALDGGNLTIARYNTGSVFGLLYGFWAGGNPINPANVIDQVIKFAEVLNASDVGDLSTNRGSMNGGCSGSVYGFFGGGSIQGSAAASNVIDYITLMNPTQNSTDKGDLTIARSSLTALNGPTYGFFAGGIKNTDTTPVVENTIDYITLATTSGNATDKGDLTVARFNLAALNGVTKGYFCGGYGVSSLENVIDYINSTTTSGNATDTGDLTVSRRGIAGSTGLLNGFLSGGHNGLAAYYNTIDYLVLETATQNAVDSGDLPTVIAYAGGIGL